VRILISPAKKMRADADSLAPDALPQFLPEAETLRAAMRELSDRELQSLWNCSEALARFHAEQLRTLDLRHRLTPAVLAYDGIQYRYMAPNVFETAHFSYIREHLRILSGLYGLLRPFDGVAPYRLEMQARLSVGGRGDLYAFWGERLASQLARETDLVLNLASREYSRAVEPHLPASVRFLTCVFQEWENGRAVEKGTLCKMARGRMVRWLAENRIAGPEAIRDFAELGYRFSKSRSTETNLVFIKEEHGNAGSGDQSAGFHAAGPEWKNGFAV